MAFGTRGKSIDAGAVTRPQGQRRDISVRISDIESAATSLPKAEKLQLNRLPKALARVLLFLGLFSTMAYHTQTQFLYLFGEVRPWAVVKLDDLIGSTLVPLLGQQGAAMTLYFAGAVLGALSFLTTIAGKDYITQRRARDDD